jgi:hypothetical protein
MLRKTLIPLVALLVPATQDGGGVLPRLADDAVKVARVGEGSLEALRAGNAWLASHRTFDGAWSVAGDRSEPSLAASGMALLALLADGSTTRSGLHPDAVREASTWLLPRAADEPAARPKAIALLALSELARLDPGAVAPEPLQLLTDRLVAQAMAEGGFPAYDAPRADSIATAWAVAGLCEARQAGMQVPEGVVEAAVAWIEERVEDTGAVTVESNSGAMEHGTALFLLPRLVAGRQLDEHRDLRRQAGRLSRRPALPDIEQEDPEYWYAAATSLALASEVGAYRSPESAEAREERAGLREAERRFHGALEAMFREEQLREGPDGGAWLGLGWAPEAGRVRSTAMAVLALAAPYRVAPVPPPPPVRGKFGSRRPRRNGDEED